MEYLYLGEIVNTHGIKGEVRIISDFQYKNEIFKKGNALYIGNYKDKVIINSYRVHKNYDMVTFNDINDINDVLKYKGKKVFIIREDYKFPGLLYDDIIGYNVYNNDKKLGEVKEIIKSSAHHIIVVKEENEKEFMVPFIDEFVKEINVEERKIDIELIAGLMDEN